MPRAGAHRRPSPARRAIARGLGAGQGAAALGVAVVAFAALAGCSAEPAPAASAPPVESAPPSPSPTLEPAEPETTLFTVAAKARAVDGTSIDLLLTGHQPVDATTEEASDLVDDFLALCGESGGLSTSEAGTSVSEQTLARFGSSLMRIDYAGTPADQPFLAPVEVIVGIDNFARVGSGDGLSSLQTTDTCLNRYQLTGSGSGTFVANYESGAADADPAQWRFGSYGFTVPIDSGATLESCEVTITPLGRASLTGLAGWADGATGTGISCGTGYQGE